MPLLDALFLLLFGHALADFVLQPEAMGYGKNRNDKIHDKEHSLFPVWWYWLTAHALVHGGVVYVLAGVMLGSSYALLLGIVETVIHWWTDFAKCEGWITPHQDQAIHIGCKIVYALLIVYGVL
jgi:hypothetical protein